MYKVTARLTHQYINEILISGVFIEEATAVGKTSPDTIRKQCIDHIVERLKKGMIPVEDIDIQVSLENIGTQVNLEEMSVDFIVYGV